MNLFQEYQRNVTRRYFFSQGSHALGWASLASLMGRGIHAVTIHATAPRSARRSAP